MSDDLPIAPATREVAVDIAEGKAPTLSRPIPLVWAVGPDGDIAADAFGINRLFQISGRPGQWSLQHPQAGRIRIDGPFETQAAARKAAQAEYERRVGKIFDPPTDASVTVQSAAETLLAVWEPDLNGPTGPSLDYEPWRRLLVAGTFAAEAYRQAPTPDARAGAMVHAFLQGAVDPASTKLDRLRANAPRSEQGDQ